MSLQSQILFLHKNKDIVIDLYQYYFNNGFQSIITEKITRLLISYFMIFLYNFLINCIDYHGIIYLSSSSTKSIYDFIDMSK